MSDIVDRLRASITQCRAIDRAALLAEAADEVERVQEEVVRLNREVSALISECQKQKDLLVNGIQHERSIAPTGSDAALTPVDRLAIEWAAAIARKDSQVAVHKTLHRLLDRLS